MFWQWFYIISSIPTGMDFKTLTSTFCCLFFIEWSVYNQVLPWPKNYAFLAILFTVKVNSYMINSYRTWLIFSILTFSILALDGIYFPIMSVKISIISLGGIWHHCCYCSTPTKCSAILDIATLVFLHFWCNSNTWISTNPCVQRSEILLPFASPSLGFRQMM
jgi:hypothetical protein